MRAPRLSRMWKAPYPVDSRRIQLCRTIVISRCEQSAPPKRHRAYGSRPPAFNTGVPTRGLSNLSPFPGCAACPQSGNDRGQIGICRGRDGYHCIRDTPAVPDGERVGSRVALSPRVAAGRYGTPPRRPDRSPGRPRATGRGFDAEPVGTGAATTTTTRANAHWPATSRRRMWRALRFRVVSTGPTGSYGSTPGSLGIGRDLGRVPDFPGRYLPNGPWKIAPNV